MHPEDNTALAGRAATLDDAPALYAMYARVSSRLQEQEETIERQIMELEALARDLGGTIPVELRFIDNGYSGDTPMRPHLYALRQTLRERPLPCQKLLIYDHDRLARESGLGIMLENEIVASGTELVYHVGGPRRNDRNSKLSSGVLKLVAEHNKATILDQLYGGMLTNIREGRGWRSIVNYGYVYHRRPRRNLSGCFEFDPATERYVVMIYEWILGGKSAIWVAKELTRLGAPLPLCRRKDISPTRPWNDAAVREIIHNPAYSGLATFGRWERVEPTYNKDRDPFRQVQKSSVRERPRDQWQFFPVPAYVTPAVQADARARLTARKSQGNGVTTRPYLLQGLLKCGLLDLEMGQPCHRRLDSHTETRRKDSHRNAYHRCTRWYDQGDGTRTRCKTTIPAYIAEDLVWEHLTGVLRHPDLIMEQMAQQQDGAAGSIAQQEADLAAYHRSLAKVQGALDTLLDLRLEGGIDPETYQRKQQQLTASRAALEQNIAQTDKRLGAMRVGLATWEAVERTCRDLETRLVRLEGPAGFAHRQALCRLLIQEVVVYPDRLHVVGEIPCAEGQISLDEGGAETQSTDQQVRIGRNSLPFLLTIPRPHAA